MIEENLFYSPTATAGSHVGERTQHNNKTIKSIILKAVFKSKNKIKKQNLTLVRTINIRATSQPTCYRTDRYKR